MYSPELLTKAQIAEILWRVLPKDPYNDQKKSEQLLRRLIHETSLWDDSKLDMELRKALGVRLIHFVHGLYRLKYS